MLQHHREIIRTEEVTRLHHWRKKGVLRWPWSKQDVKPDEPTGQEMVDVYSISVERGFIPFKSNEEYPLVILDVGETLLVLFGQWLYDPHTIIVSDDIFEKWISDKNFFANFSLRGYAKEGIAFQLKIEGDAFVPVERLDSGLKFLRLREYELISGNSETLVQDLQRAGILQA